MHKFLLLLTLALAGCAAQVDPENPLHMRVQVGLPLLDPPMRVVPPPPAAVPVRAPVATTARRAQPAIAAASPAAPVRTRLPTGNLRPYEGQGSGPGSVEIDLGV